MRLASSYSPQRSRSPWYAGSSTGPPHLARDIKGKGPVKPHAAALALVGWYLMMPVLDPHSWEPIGGPRPLSQWDNEGSYDTARECMQARDELPDKLYKLNLPPKAIARLITGQCIASDDPRLKEK
jgi:hypothetical protein